MSIDLRGRGVRWIAITVAAVVVVELLIAVYVRSTRPHQEPKLPATSLGFRPVCGDDPGTAFTKAAVYEGAGPHDIVAVVSRDSTSGIDNIPDSQHPPGALPWEGGYLVRDIQLVACVVRLPGEERRAGQCTYGTYRQQLSNSVFGTRDGSTLPLLRAEYEVTIRAASTREEIASARLDGTSLDCPDSVGVTAQEVYSWPSAAQWQRAFGRYVTGPR